MVTDAFHFERNQRTDSRRPGGIGNFTCFQIAWYAVGLRCAFHAFAPWSTSRLTPDAGPAGFFIGGPIIVRCVGVISRRRGCITAGSRMDSTSPGSACSRRNFAKLRLYYGWAASEQGQGRNCEWLKSFSHWSDIRSCLCVDFERAGPRFGVVFLAVSLAMMFRRRCSKHMLAGLVCGIGLLVILVVAAIL